MTELLLKVIGLYFLIYSASIILNKDRYKQLMKEFLGQSAFPSFLVGFLALIIGLLILVPHNTWSTLPEIIVSLYGLLALLKGVFLLLFPAKMEKLAEACCNDTYLNLVGPVMLLIGLYITYLAYMGS